MIKCECREESWQYDFACDYCEDQIEKDRKLFELCIRMKLKYLGE